MKKLAMITLILFAFITLSNHVNAQENTIWWEGEDYTSTNCTQPLARVPGNANPQQQEKLSGGKWMTPHNSKDGGPVTITYDIQVPEKKTYNFWVRKFWKHGPFKWRFDNMEWNECGKRITLHDSTFIAENWGANWVSLGKVELDKGPHTSPRRNDRKQRLLRRLAAY